MPNEFSQKPQLDADFPKQEEDWTCPITGITVPKDPQRNLEWRTQILALADEDPELQAELVTACSQSLLFFVNAFAFTYRLFEPDPETGEARQAKHNHVPFVTWDIQDQHLLRLEHCIEYGEDLLTDKSRDMGATWNHIAVYAHRLLYRDNESHLVISRKEDAVDQLSGQPRNYPHGSVADPGTLFGKLDYIVRWLPEWMLPKLHRKKLHIVNETNGCRIDGESANANAGTSDRRTSIFLDEMSKMDYGESIKRSTRDVTACRLPCSTPNGAGTAYSKWRTSGAIPVFVLPWWEHPEKGAGRYVEQDDLGRWKIRSPWYNSEEQRRSPKEMAIEIDMDHVGSGDTFFEAMVLEEHKVLFGQPPRRTLSINFKKKVPDADVPDALIKQDSQKIVFTPSGPWRVWCALDKGRPDQSRTYTLGVDISKGMGASNSVISIMCNETREKIAEFADANTPPYELARIACAACLWAGGKQRPLLIWENNGDPGFDFNNQIARVYRYPNMYFDRQKGTLSQKRGKRFGWRSDREKKAAALGLLRRAYARGGFINHSVEAINEAATYVTYEGGGIGPAEMVEESESTRSAHGDRVIADMLCLVGVEGVGISKPERPATPEWSIGGRKKQWAKSKKRKQQEVRFDFRAGV